MDAGRAELLPDLEQSKLHISTLENRLHDEEERHKAEVAVMKREGYIHGQEEISPNVSTKPTDQRTASSGQAAHPCPHPMFNICDNSHIRPNPWASIAQCHTQYTRSRSRRLYTNFFCKQDTSSSRYIIPPHRTSSTFISNTNSLHTISSTVISDALAYSLALPSRFFSIF